MLPQSIREEGGYKIRGKTPADAEALRADAHAIEKAGAFAVVLELVQADVAARISCELTIPTIGIGSGPACDGQVLVSHDLIGLFPWFKPKFARQHAHVATAIREAATLFRREVKEGYGQ
jgi:3-methyl-2-oxobutanoate hydroxymethyltransferase